MSVKKAPSYDYSNLKTAADVSTALTSMKAQAHKDQSVTKAQVQALQDKVDELNLGSVSLQKGTLNNTMDSNLNLMKNSTLDSGLSGAGGSFTNAIWDVGIDSMVKELGDTQDVATQQAAVASGTSTADGTAVTTPDLTALRTQYGTPDDKSVFAAVNNQLGVDLQASPPASDATIQQDIENAASAYYDPHGPRQDSRNTDDLMKHLKEQFAKDPASAAKWSDYANTVAEKYKPAADTSDTTDTSGIY